MTPADLQIWLGQQGHPVAVDGDFGPASRAALLAAFSNPAAATVTPAEVAAFADRLGCTAKQLQAVAAVESSGSGFDPRGRPKMLFERHLFYRITDGRFGIKTFSAPEAGGYNLDSWTKLELACGCDVDAAFAAASWGKFQVLGSHWASLGYASPLDLAWSTVESEAGHYELLARFIQFNRMEDAIRTISRDSTSNIKFARLFNGPAYRTYSYDIRLARAMA